MKNIFIVVISVVFVFVSCKEDTVVQKVSYDEKTKTKIKSTKVDTTKIEIADLPVQFDGTYVLIFPIGRLQISANEKISFESAEASEMTNFKISNNSDSEITGFMTNIKFQKLGQDSLVALSKDKLFIQSVTYLKDVAQQSKLQFLVYVLEDADTNKDGAINQDDINTLYISDIQGQKLTKLSPNLEELIDWNIVASSNRLYFRTIADTNKNGKFDKADIIHYSFVNLLDKNFKVEKFNAL